MGVEYKKRIFLERDKATSELKVEWERGKKMCRIVFHLLEDPSALLYTHYVSFTLYYKYPME